MTLWCGQAGFFNYGVVRCSLFQFPNDSMSDNKLESEDLKKAGLKVTLPRLKILKILEETKPRHISAEEVYRQLLAAGDDVGLATIYRVLSQFEDAKLVRRHHFDTGHALYELDEGEHHDHILYIKCGLVEEFIDKIIEEQQVTIASKYNFKITAHSHYLYGLCETCQV